MRVSREQADKNRQGVIDAASQLFRERGFDGIGVIELMQGAGLTKGAFYKQFKSKEDLTALASTRAMELSLARWTSLMGPDAKTSLEVLIGLYLSEEHREEMAAGCPLVALGADAARQGHEVKESFEAGIKTHLALLNERVLSGQDDESLSKSSAIMAIMVGALTISRMVNDDRLSKGFLTAAADQVRSIAASSMQ